MVFIAQTERSEADSCHFSYFGTFFVPPRTGILGVWTGIRGLGLGIGVLDWDFEATLGF